MVCSVLLLARCETATNGANRSRHANETVPRSAGTVNNTRSFALGNRKSRDVRLAQFSTQIIVKQGMLHGVQGLTWLVGTPPKRKPSVITSPHMIALGTRFTTLTLF